jgi:hypothetical protein
MALAKIYFLVTNFIDASYADAIQKANLVILLPQSLVYH